MKEYTIEVRNNPSGIYVRHIVMANSHEEAREKLQEFFDELGYMEFYRMVTTCKHN